MKYNHVLMATLLTVFICLTLQAQHQHKQEIPVEKSQQAAKEVYSCPMHPEVISATPGECPKCGMKLEKQATEAEQSPSSMMGKPTFEQTTQGLTIRVWMITQTEHKQMMKDHGLIGGATKGPHEMMGMNHSDSAEKEDHHMMNSQMQHDAKDMDEESMKSMLAGTHHIMVIVQDETGKMEREIINVEVRAISPTEKNSTVTLTPIMKHYGGGLTLDQNGEYKITVWVREREAAVQSDFEYEVRSTGQNNNNQ